MTQPTSIGSELSKLTPRLRAQRALAEDCSKHPGSTLLACPACAEEQREQERNQTMAEAAECWKEFPPRYQQATTDRPDVLTWVKQFREDPTNAPSLLLLGPTSTGKTWQAYGALRAAVTTALPVRSGGFRSPRWKALTYADLCASLRPRGWDYDTEAVLERYRKVELLFVDDLGAAKVTEAVEEATYRLINGRYNEMRPSIFTSNLPVTELRDALGDRIASRLNETCIRVIIDGPDWRQKLKVA